MEVVGDGVDGGLDEGDSAADDDVAGEGVGSRQKIAEVVRRGSKPRRIDA